MWAIVRDITEQKEAEEELQRAYLELEGFSHTVSHDLRSPLASIGLGAEMTRRILSNAELSAGVRSELEEVISLETRSIERPGKFIESMLALAEAGQVPGDVSPVDIGVVVRNVLEEKAERVATDGITVDVSGDLGSVRASPTHVYQLFANLTGNAIAYNDSDYPRMEVIRLEDDGRGGHRYLVRDNGSGI